LASVAAQPVAAAGERTQCPNLYLKLTSTRVLSSTRDAFRLCCDTIQTKTKRSGLTHFLH